MRPLNKARKTIKIRDLIAECNERIKKFIQIDDQDFVEQHSSELHGLLEKAHDLEELTPKDRVSEWKHTRNDIEKASEEDRKTVITEMLLDLEERIVIAEDDDGSFS